MKLVTQTLQCIPITSFQSFSKTLLLLGRFETCNRTNQADEQCLIEETLVFIIGGQLDDSGFIQDMKGLVHGSPAQVRFDRDVILGEGDIPDAFLVDL
ncbi:MAG: hypothetical protein IKQ20_03725 [Bacteroidales bacterium]|nr:hypothetical protein [Bacteroidales bacterium]